MGNKPSAAADAVAGPAVSGTYAISRGRHARRADRAPNHENPATISRFGMPHALVVSVCIATAAILAPPAMAVGDILLLIASAGGIGATIGIAANSGRRRTERPDHPRRARLLQQLGRLRGLSWDALTSPWTAPFRHVRSSRTSCEPARKRWA
ncbi:hypothetical protein SHIRM173S_06317 [Streptomyces hirsutus]